jgi:hypothetical protein
MQTLGTVLGVVGGLIFLVCHIMVIIQMFQHGQTGLGIACAVLTLCCGISGLFTFIYGWVKATPWNIKNLMLLFTLGIALQIVGNIMAPIDYTVYVKQIQGQQ